MVHKAGGASPCSQDGTQHDNLEERKGKCQLQKNDSVTSDKATKISVLDIERAYHD